jgi:homoserine O-acetyltransferase
LIGDLALACGSTLPDVVQRVSVYGTPAPDGSNVALVAHALTGSSRVADWWDGLVGPGKLLDPAEVAIVGVNMLGGCYGSTGPASRSRDGEPYGARFPLITVGDIVEAQARALERLGLGRAAAVIGGSLGGMQAVEWALRFPGRIGHAVAIGAYDHFSAMGIALNHVAREAVAIGGVPMGLELARKIAMLTYKSDALFRERFGRKPDRGGGDPYREPGARFDIEGYLDYQGRLFSARMNPHSYVTLTRAMDLFDTTDRVLEPPRPAMTFVGISSDWLFLPADVRAAAMRFAGEGADSAYLELRSQHGHDAFLAEPAALAALLQPRLASALPQRRAAIADSPRRAGRR